MKVSGERLLSFVERIERLEAEKAELGADVREVFLEAKATGFDVKVLRKVVKLRKVDEADRREEDALLDAYMRAIGEAQSGKIPISEVSKKTSKAGTVPNKSGAPTPHDPETGEVIEDAKAGGLFPGESPRQDQTFSKTGRKSASRAPAGGVERVPPTTCNADDGDTVTAADVENNHAAPAPDEDLLADVPDFLLNREAAA